MTLFPPIFTAPCSIAPDSSNHEICLGEMVTVLTLDKKGGATPETIKIKLENCELKDDGGNKFSITFDGNNLAADNTLPGTYGSVSGASVAVNTVTVQQIELDTYIQQLNEPPCTLRAG